MDKELVRGMAEELSKLLGYKLEVCGDETSHQPLSFWASHAIWVELLEDRFFLLGKGIVAVAAIFT